MNVKTTNTLLLAAALSVVPQIASAQTMQWTDKGYITFNVGAQAGSDDLETNSSFSLYEETATTSSTQKISGGAFFEIGGAYRVWGNNLLAGVSFTRTKSDADIAITGSIPDPLVFDRPRAVSATHPDAEHSENAIHLDAIWMIPVANKLDVGIFGGPSIFMIAQDTIASLSVAEPGPTVTPQITEVKKTTVGVNFGVDVQYMVRNNIAVGGLLRYAWGSADIDGASDSLGVGGFQFGVGVRYRLK